MNFPKTEFLIKPIFILLLLLSITPLPAQEIPAPIPLSFSVAGGFYDTAFEVSLFHSSEAKIYYTLDGSQPSSAATLYRSPILIDTTTILRAIAFVGTERSSIYTQSYLFDLPESNFPTLSIGIDPWRLFDSESGLFMLGSKADLETLRLSGANFWSRQEIPAHLEYFTAEGTCVFNSELGFRLFGGISRLFPQKSMALVTRPTYGEKHIDYPIFGKKGPKKTEYLVLRNAGSDFGKAHIRDVLVTDQVRDWEVDVQAYQAAHVYINGTYWGIYNLREKINRHFLADHHDVDKDSLDLLEHNMTLKRGSRRHYQRLIQYLEANDLSDHQHYAQVQEWIDVESFMDFQIAQIFFDNRDAGGNIRYWRSQEANAKWRWILYDMDWAMGLHNVDAYEFNSLAFHTRPDGPSWPNPPWSTFILRKLLENEGFRQAFLTRFSDHLNEDLSTARLLQAIDEKQNLFRPEIDRHLERWNLNHHRWESQFNRLRTFAEKRPVIMREHLQNFFQADSLVQLQMLVKEGGQVRINRHLELEQTHFSGYYFQDYPIHLSAEANLGYRFVHWENQDGQILSSEALLEALPLEGLQYKAVFEAYDHPLAGVLLINEIAPNNKNSKDWVELYNRSEDRIPLGDFVLRDQKGNQFVFPKNAYIAGRDYLIVCQSKARFQQAFPLAYNVIGDLGFGINKYRESLELFDNRKAAIDSVAYTIEPTDELFSWNLLLPRLDNGDPENWQQSFGLGTANEANPYYMESTIGHTQSWWMQLSLGLGGFLLAVSLIYFSWVREG
jgi:ABC-type uncharacterized transport system auxiliary subunit